MSMNGGVRSSTNARPGGDYQAPVMPTSGRFGGEGIRPEKWDEVLRYLQQVLADNAKLNEALEENNRQVEQIINQKNSEIEQAHKLYWDVRISVLGFKTKIMALNGEIDRLQSEANSGGPPGGGEASAEMNELKLKIKDLEGKKQSAEHNATHLQQDLLSLKQKLEMLESSSRRATENHQYAQQNLTRRIQELEEELKRKGNSPPQPKPRTNIHVQPIKPDGKVIQLERENESLRSEYERQRNKAQQEHNSRQQAEEMIVRMESELRSKQSELDDVIRAKVQLEGKIKTLETRASQPINEGQGGNNPSMMVAGAGGGIKQRRMLNQAMEERNRFETRATELEEENSSLQAQLTEKMRQWREAMDDMGRLKMANSQHDSRIQELEQTYSDKEYALEQKVSNSDEEICRLKTQLQNLNEKNHKLTVELAKAVSTLKSKQEQADKEDWNQLNEMEELMNTVEEKNSTIEQLQTQLHQTLQQLNNSEGNHDRLMEKLKKKEADCKSYLDQMETWRLQYETAQADFAQERAVREKEAIAVKTLKENRDALQKEIGELRKRVTDQRITIANLQTQPGYTPESYTKEINVPPDKYSPNMSGMGRRPHPSYEPPAPYDDVHGGGASRWDPPNRDPPNPVRDHPIPRDTPNPREPNYRDTPNSRDMHMPTPRIKPDPVIKRDDYGMEHIGRVPEPRLGTNLPPPDPINQLNNPPIPSSRQQGGGGAGNNPPFHSPSNAFPQFTGQDRPPRGGGSGFDLPGEVQKMEAPVIDNCPICGRSGFKTQTELEVHAAKCG